jgi:large subunit ribosomal protein L29
MKASETHKFKDEELTVEVERLRKQHFELRTQAVTEKLENPKQLGNIRRDIARLLTEQRARQLREAAK